MRLKPICVYRFSQWGVRWSQSSMTTEFECLWPSLWTDHCMHARMQVLSGQHPISLSLGHAGKVVFTTRKRTGHHAKSEDMSVGLASHLIYTYSRLPGVLLVHHHVTYIFVYERSQLTRKPQQLRTQHAALLDHCWLGVASSNLVDGHSRPPLEFFHTDPGKYSTRRRRSRWIGCK